VSRAPRWGVFLDRDGTLLHLVPYLDDPARARLYAGVGPALKRLSDAGAALVLVTNQSGIARGYFSRKQVDAVHGRLEALLARHGVTLDAIEVCPHHPDVTGRCDCRKPAPGMILRAAKRLGIDPGASWTIGDNASDLGAARAAGTRAALVLTGYGRRTRAGREGRGADLVGGTLASVVERLLAIHGAESPGHRRRGRRTRGH
jgi:histidinol-phosphate phosphatase family protein